MKDILKIVFVIIGTLIGAGFASGQEVYRFFFLHGKKGIIGILISSLLMGIIIYKALCLIDKYNIKTYKELLGIFSKPKQNEKYFNLRNITNIVINIFILITFFIMVAGFGAYFEQELGMNSLIGSIMLASLCFFVLMTNVKGVVKANEILVPILIIFIVVVGIISIMGIDFTKIGTHIIEISSSNYLISAILYCSYNSILTLPVLITLKNYLKNKKQIISISIIATMIIIILSVIIFLLLIKVDVDISELEMPAVYVVSNMFKIFKTIYGLIILGSIFTTAISLGSSFLQNTSKNKKSYAQNALIMCITSVLVSKIGFSNLINLLYPIFGYLGIIQIITLMLQKA